MKPTSQSIKNNKNNKSFFQNLSTPDFQKTPFLLVFLFLIFVFNLVVFLLPRLLGITTELPTYLVLFANHAGSVLHNNQYWRLFTFFLVENMSGIFNIIFVFIFLWIVVVRNLYFQEIILGSKKTAFIVLTGIIIVGLLQVFFTVPDEMIYHGTSFISWISLGSIFCIFLFNASGNEPLKSLSRRLFIRGLIFLLIWEYIKYTNAPSLSNTNNSLVWLSTLNFIFPVISFVIGFLLSLLADLKNCTKLTQNALLVFSAVFCLFLLGFIIFTYIMGFKVSTDLADKIRCTLETTYLKWNISC